MEIEMGESIIFSWLRHVKRCNIVQLNWKYSPKWDQNNLESANELKNQAEKLFRANHGWEIFKKNRSLDQIIRQAEIDVLGQSHEGIFAIDVANHGDGVNYGDANETCSRVIKKIIRMSICMMVYFPNQKANCIFASPKINPAILPTLNSTVKEANGLVNSHNIECSLLCNEAFYQDVYLEVEKNSNKLSDGSELFLRSLQLIELTQKYKREQKSTPAIIIPENPSQIPMEDSNIEIIKVLKAQTHQSWVNLRKAVNKQLALPYSFGTTNVENAAVSFLNKCKKNTKMSTEEILLFLDQNNLGIG